MKKGRLKEIVAELQGASKMHLKQSKEIEKHIEDMGSPAQKRSVTFNQSSTWFNILTLRAPTLIKYIFTSDTLIIYIF